ncbi:hypothetical protein FSW04_06240 [Baekduia soli]|uniref:Uncharacterized protein n=1 Tax=Baekduia soli TaxID=496014 RepID=A0A5B8U2P5_9ACTN|nr:hypothetical protein [Baekduia soli]QEC47230.1 hypothetical protein FSW04_06240 [Baekduia soli]
MSGRSADELLAELGGTLERAWGAEGRRRGRCLPRPRLRRRGLVAGAIAALVLVPTAVATREAIWAPDPPPMPAQLRPRDAVVPGAAGTPVWVGSGTESGVAWRLSATTCRYGTVQAVGLFLTVPGGGAGARCDVAARRPGSLPQALATRRVQTYFDPLSGMTWAFGALPARARTVSVTSRPYGGGPARSDRVTPGAVAPAAVVQGHLPAGLRVFVVALAGGRDVAHVEAADDAGRTVLTCDAGRCDR